MLMLNDADEVCIILYDSDFPDYYINQEHPEDYKLMREPVLDYIYHAKKYHNRLLLRISFKIDNDLFVPITFVCDTGAPGSLYLSEKAREQIEDARILKDRDLGIEYIKLSTTKKKIQIDDPPSNHKNINIMGLMALSRFGLNVDYESFDFKNLPDYL